MNNWIARNIICNFVEIVCNERISKYLKQIRDIPYFQRNEILKLQSKKIRRVITTAHHNIPFYKKKFDEAGLDINRLVLPDDISRIPILAKHDVQRSYDQLINQNIRKRVTKGSTSGSTGNPMVVIKDRDKSAYVRAVMFRCYSQYGINIGDKQARFWGMPLKKKEYSKERLKDFIANRIRFSAFQLSEEYFSEFVKRLKRFRPKYFCGYPSVIFRFAQWLEANTIKLNNLDLSVIITTGEVLYDFQRELLEETFNCKVSNEYGLTEAGILAFECREGNMHINADHVYMEINNPQPLDGTGEIVITELNNIYNPLIRYKTGDIGSISNDLCDCGIRFPVLKNLVGREDSYIVTSDNRYVYDAILAYTLKDGISQFQGIQNKKGELIVRIVKNKDFKDKMIGEYKSKLSKTLGDSMRIKFDFVSKIETEKSGKLRYFISDIN